MSAHAYPHIVFATDSDTLPRADLEALVHELFGDQGPTVTHGPLQVEVRLGDYAFTFWYDDDADGLGERYADFAPPLKKRRVGRCTTMIDMSGAPDPAGEHVDDARRLTRALAERPGVYVFSEDTKSFVGLDEHDPFADAPTPEPAPEDDDIPAIAPPVAIPPVAIGPAAVPPVAPAELDVPAAQARVDQTPLTPASAAGRPGAARDGDAENGLAPEPVEPAPTPAQVEAPAAAAPVEPERPGDDTTERPSAQPGTPQEQPTDHDSPEREGGFFKRLFGRGRR